MLTPYKCPAGYLTIGIGHNIDTKGLPKQIKTYLDKYGQITNEMADTLFEADVEDAITDCHLIFPNFDYYTEDRQIALIDLIFNMGNAKIRKGFPSFVRAVITGDWGLAADELKYSNGVTKNKLSDYWKQLHGEEKPDSRPAEIYQMIKEG